MKILILTNHLSVFGGSEVVSVEVADAFSKLGCVVSIFSAYITDPVRSYMDELGLQYGAIENCPNPKNFDIIWSQHQLLPYLLEKYGTNSVDNVFLVNASLSPYEPLEIPGAIAEIADMTIANSPETGERLVELGVSADKVSVFHNAAPDTFNLTRKAEAELKRVLIISNHMPEEVASAATILRTNGLTVDHIGLPSQQKRITPEIILSYDAVISIGKSVQYSLLCETPVYIYDRFGGPGWLNETNAAEAEKFNFSGRCCRRKIAPEAIVEELLDGYPDAISVIRVLKRTYSEKYTLQNYLTQIIERAPKRIDERSKRRITPSISKIIQREGLLSGQLITLYRTTQNQSSDIAEMASNIERLSSEAKKISERVSEIELDRLNIILSHEETQSSYLREISEKNLIIDQLKQKLEEIMSSTSWKITKPIRKIKERLLR